MSHSWKWNSSQGFTLIELLVVLALVGILAAVAVPSIIQMRYSLNYRSAARDVASILRNARSLAISENKEFQVQIDTVNKQYRLKRGSRVFDTPVDTESEWTVIKPYVSVSDITTIATSEPTKFIFRPNGSATCSPDSDGNSTNDETVSIQDSSGTTKYTLTISPLTGRIRIN